jgi:uncharacterized membrane protein YraQ (UPF0718 family)
MQVEPNPRGESLRGMWWVAAAVAGIVLFPRTVRTLMAGPVARTWATIMLSVAVQAIPFLVLGVLLSSVMAVVLRPEVVARVVPRRPALSVAAATLAGAALPGCECSSVVVAGRLMASGVPEPAALAFLLAAPAINPVVLVATAVAFPGQPRVVFARFVASLAASVVVGLLWIRTARSIPVCRPRGQPSADGRWSLFAGSFVEDFAVAGAFLVLGAAATATLQVTVHPDSLATMGAGGLLGVPVLALLAVMLCVCSEADAFVAATFTQFSPTARLAFMVVGPMVDLKLVALQTGTFGRRFAARFAPLAFAAALCAAVLTGSVLL